MAFRDAMEVTQSPPMTWEDWVQEEEEECERHSSTGDSQPCLSSPQLEGCDVSDISMAEEGPQQCNSDVMVEEEREESMETDAPLDSATPAPLKEEVIPEDLEAGVEEDCHSQMSEESTDQNPPHDSDPDKDKLLGLLAGISIPGGHSNDSIALMIPQVMMTYKCDSKSMTAPMTHGMKPAGLGSFEPASPASCNRSNFDFVCFLCINHVLYFCI